MNDPIVAEVRQIREQIARECEFNMHKLFELQEHFCDQWKGKKVIRPFHPDWQAPHAAVVADGNAEYMTKIKKPAQNQPHSRGLHNSERIKQSKNA